MPEIACAYGFVHKPRVGFLAEAVHVIIAHWHYYRFVKRLLIVAGQGNSKFICGAAFKGIYQVAVLQEQRLRILF